MSPMATISAVALLRGNAPAKQTAQLYVEALQPPVDLSVDGVFVRNLTRDLPFTTVDLDAGDHRVVADSADQHYEQLVQLKGGTSVIVRIPSSAAKNPWVRAASGSAFLASIHQVQTLRL